MVSIVLLAIESCRSAMQVIYMPQSCRVATLSKRCYDPVTRSPRDVGQSEVRGKDGGNAQGSPHDPMPSCPCVGARIMPEFVHLFPNQLSICKVVSHRPCVDTSSGGAVSEMDHEISRLGMNGLLLCSPAGSRTGNEKVVSVARSVARKFQKGLTDKQWMHSGESDPNSVDIVKSEMAEAAASVHDPACTVNLRFS